MSILTKIFQKKENKFDYIFSLGYNCEVAFRTLKYFKFEESSLFNWCYIDSIDTLLYALDNFNSIGTEDFDCLSYLWQCKATKIKFHGKASIELYVNKSNSSEEINKDKKDLAERLNYLKNKFLKILQNESKKLYIYKIKNSDINEQIDFKINLLLDLLKKLGGNNFNLLIISEEKYSQKFTSENYIYRTVKYYAPDNNVTSKKYYNNGWNNIFDEFYLAKTRKKIKKYKFGDI